MKLKLSSSSLPDLSMPPHFSISPNSRVPLSVIYEDDDLVALSKPAGIVTQPGINHLHDTLLNGAFSRWGKQLQNLGKKRDFGLLHRLDRGTSGLVLIALNASSYDSLRDLFQRRALVKRYWAIVSGPLTPASGRCQLPIAEVYRGGNKRAQVCAPSESRHLRRGSHQRVHSSIRPQRALTFYETLARGSQDATLIRCQLHTGRLHQIRAHLAALGSPVLGDFDYGGKRPLNILARRLQRGHLALHAGELELNHPRSGAPLHLLAPCSAWMSELATQLNVPIPQELRST